MLPIAPELSRACLPILRFNKTCRPPHCGLETWIFVRLIHVREIAQETKWRYDHTRTLRVLPRSTPRASVLICEKFPTHYTGPQVIFPIFQRDVHNITLHGTTFNKHCARKSNRHKAHRSTIFRHPLWPTHPKPTTQKSPRRLMK